MIDMSMSAERYNLRPVTLIMTKTSQPEKTTDFSLRHYWFPREVTSEKLQKLIRNSILMTRHYSDLGSASDWLNQISHAARPIRSTNQIWVVLLIG